MRRYLGVLALVAAICAAVPSQPARAGWNWNGHTWTVAIVAAIGAAAAGYFLAYESATLRAKGSVKQAETVMDLPLFGPNMRAPISTADPQQLSLQKLRGIVIADVAYEDQNIKDPAQVRRWRSDFETFRTCWNVVLATPPTPEPSASPSSKASSEPSTSPTHSSKPSGGQQHGGQQHGGQNHGGKPPAADLVAYEPAVESDAGGGAAVAASGGNSNQKSPGKSKTDKTKPAGNKPTSGTHTPKPADQKSPGRGTPTPSASPSSPPCQQLFEDVLKKYSGDLTEASRLIGQSGSSSSSQQSSSATATPSPSASEAANLAFYAQTQIDPTDLASYLAKSPSLLSQLADEQVGSFVTDDYVRDLFLATAAVKFINALPTPTPIPTPTPTPPTSIRAGAGVNVLSLLEPLATDCSGVTGVTGGVKCLNDVGNIETAYANARIERESCYWVKHVYMPTYSDIETWSQQRAQYGAANSTRILGNFPNDSTIFKNLITVTMPDTLSTSAGDDKDQKLDPTLVVLAQPNDPGVKDALGIDMMILTVPQGC